MRLLAKRAVQTLAKAFFGLLFLSLVVACTSKSNSKTGTATGTISPIGLPSPSPSGTTTPTPRTADGTGDSTGGNGINGKPFESFIVADITQLPEWKEWIAPIETHLNSGPDKQARGLFTRIASTKRWYFVPIELNTIPKKQLGVDFIQDPVQQLALQTTADVWINSNLYEKSSSRDRAMLLMHEVIVAIYLLRFETVPSLCNSFLLNCSGEVVEASKAPRFQPETRRPMVENDYQNIRAVTSILFDSATSLKSDADYQGLFQAHNFDPRFYGSHETFEFTVADVDAKEVKEWITAQIRLGAYPRFLSRTSPRQKSEPVELGFDSDKNENLQMKTSEEILSFRWNPVLDEDEEKKTAKFEMLPISTSSEQKLAMTGSIGAIFADVKNLQVGQQIPTYYFFLAPEHFTHQHDGKAYALNELVISAIEISFVEVIAINKSEKTVDVTFGFASVDKKAPYVMTREAWQPNHEAIVDIKGGKTFTAPLPIQLFNP